MIDKGKTKLEKLKNVQQYYSKLSFITFSLQNKDNMSQKKKGNKLR